MATKVKILVMKLISVSRQKEEKLLKILAGIIILTGIAVRVIVYLQNRNLMMDEANLARNIYERGFLELTKPLNYEQFAPIFFLWLLKLSTLLFGYSEFAFRLYPLLAGIASLFMFFLVLKEFCSLKSLWYPLFLIAAGQIFIRYSSELKQHGCDMFAVLTLLYLALKTDIQTKKPVSFAITWILAGTIAIWLSFPCVFVLAGVGAYYLYICLSRKLYKKLMPLLVVILIWVAQFLLYYLFTIKKQADSNFIQSTLESTFLILVPKSKADWKLNIYLVKRILEVVGGGDAIFLKVNLGLLIWGTGYLLIKNTSRALLVLVPILCLLFASALHQYSLTDRFMIFTMALYALLVGRGFENLMNTKFIWLRTAGVAFAVYCCYDRNQLDWVYEKYRYEEITEVLSYMQEHNINGSQFYVHMTARPAMIYYTSIHPEKEKWSDFKNAHLLWWDVNYENLSQQINGRAGFVFESADESEIKKCKAGLAKHLKITDEMPGNPYDRRVAYIYSK